VRVGLSGFQKVRTTAGPASPASCPFSPARGGSVQAAYDGHPPYAYVGDRAPGQAHGNGLNLNGGLWHEVTASGRMG
jgi:predicted lipoprotein with Yx(FWY)xxD motif